MGTHANAFDFILGEWDLAMLVMPEGSTVGRRATSQVHRILDGTALLDEIRHLDEAGKINFRGASFRTYVPSTDAWYVVWVMANVEGYSELHAKSSMEKSGRAVRAEIPAVSYSSKDDTTTSLQMVTRSHSTGRTTGARRGFVPSFRIAQFVARPPVTLANTALHLTGVLTQEAAPTPAAAYPRMQPTGRMGPELRSGTDR